jgi:hypothetical protein
MPPKQDNPIVKTTQSKFEADEYEYQLIAQHPSKFHRQYGRVESIPTKLPEVDYLYQLNTLKQYTTYQSQSKPSNHWQKENPKYDKADIKKVGQV